MKVCVLTAYSSGEKNPNNFQASWVRESAALDPFKVHQLTDDPDKADIVLFVENHPENDPLFFRVAHHPSWRKGCSFLYHDNDYAYPFLPGLYPSLLRSHQRASRCVGASYVGRIERNDDVRYEPLSNNAPLLFSFMGSVNCGVRARICALKNDGAFIRNTTGENLWSLSHTKRARYTAAYGEALRNSRFVLCPRGLGPSTYRLFETMEAGRVPVILADQWVEPSGPNWAEFSIRISEKDVERVPQILAERRDEALAMSLAARAAWETWFSKPVTFHWLTEACRSVMEGRTKTNVVSEALYSASLAGTNPRLLLRFLKRTIRHRLKPDSKKRPFEKSFEQVDQARPPVI